MSYNRVSSKICIPRIYDKFSVSGAGWEGRCPEWISTAIQLIGMPLTLSDGREAMEVLDYKATLPCDIKLLRAIEYDGHRLPRIDTINTLFSDDIANQEHDVYSYQLDNNGYVIFPFETGNIVVYYKKLPIEYDADSGLWFPLIINRVEVLEAIDWYIALRMLMRGYVLTGFSMDSKNPYTNPAIQWDVTKKAAANSLILDDVGEREDISRMIRTFISNYNAYDEQFFNNTKSI